jgi:hypothetical protein
MKTIRNLTADAKQRFSVVIDGYDAADCFLEFKSSQDAWFFSMSWGTFSINNEKIVVAPNILRQFKNVLPFGILVTGIDALDPIAIDSWVNNNTFNVLSADEVAQVETDFYG